MRLQVENTLGIIYVEVEIEPGRIVEVVGPNAQRQNVAGCVRSGGVGAGCKSARIVGSGHQAQLPARRGGRCAGHACQRTWGRQRCVAPRPWHYGRHH